MNYNQRFDEHIKDQFTDYTPSVHPRIWENITAGRDKKRPAGFWFSFLKGRNLILVAALLLALGGGAAYFLLQQDGKTNTNFIAEKNTSPLPNQAAADILNNNTPASNNKSLEKIPASPVIDNNTQSDAIAPVIPAAGETNSTKNTANNNIIKATHAVNSTGLPAADYANKIYQPAKTKKINYTKTKLSITNTNATAVEEDEQEQTAFQLSTLFFIAEKSNSNNTAVTLQKRKQKNVLLPDCPSIEKNAAGNKTYLEIYGGPDVAFRSFADTANSVYLQKRKESTKFASAYSAGLRYTKVFNNGMSIRTGINYSQINEKFIYSEGNIIQVVYIINAAGDTVGSYTTTGTRYKTTHNKFRTIDVPVALGYEMGNGRLHANINAGVIINIYSWQRGEVLDYNLRPVNITTGKSNSPFQFKTNIGLGFIGAASLYYKMNDRLHFLAEPYFRYSLSAASKETTTFKQKYNTAGLRLGLRLDLQ